MVIGNRCVHVITSSQTGRQPLTSAAKKEFPDVTQEFPDGTRELPDVTPKAPRCHPDAPRCHLGVPMAVQGGDFMDLGSPWEVPEPSENDTKPWYCH